MGLVHIDICGPITPKSLGGLKFFMLIIGDFSRMTWVSLLKAKSEVFHKFEEWCILMENQTSNSLKVLRSNNGKEFVNNQFDFFCRKKSIQRQFSTPYTPQ